MSENKITSLNQDNFETTINEPSWTLVDFWAPWCQPCQILHPILEQVAESFEDKIKFYKIDITDNESLAERFNILGIPALIIFFQGEEKGRIIGLQGAEQIKETLQELLDKPL
jgi:thioredoxin 1